MVFLILQRVIFAGQKIFNKNGKLVNTDGVFAGSSMLLCDIIKNLADKNLLKIELDKGVPLVYPFLSPRKNLRQQLIANQIFVATYWPDLEKLGDIPSFERFLQEHLLPLPLDQRYEPKDLQRIVEIIWK